MVSARPDWAGAAGPLDDNILSRLIKRARHRLPQERKDTLLDLVCASCKTWQGHGVNLLKGSVLHGDVQRLCTGNAAQAEGKWNCLARVHIRYDQVELVEANFAWC